MQQLKDSPFQQKQSERQIKRRTESARFFQPPSLTQGFKYIYLSIKARLPVGKLRKLSHKLEVKNNRILDIHYPDIHIVALLIHNDYESELRSQLATFKITSKDDFDPLDPAYLRDPELLKLTVGQQKSETIDLHRRRMQRALTYIRAPVKFAVARYFLDQGWITPEFQKSLSSNQLRTTGTNIQQVFEVEYAEMTPADTTITEVPETTSSSR